MGINTLMDINTIVDTPPLIAELLTFQEGFYIIYHTIIYYLKQFVFYII